MYDGVKAMIAAEKELAGKKWCQYNLIFTTNEHIDATFKHFWPASCLIIFSILFYNILI